jgi:ribosomal protein L7/L12
MRDVVVMKFKGERALERGLNAMAKKGYVVDQQASRKALYSAATGVFTRKQIHTVTFRNQGSPVPATPVAAGQATSPAPRVDVIDQLERLGKLRDSGVLTTEEFEAQKAGLLAGSSAGAVPAPAEVVDTWDVVFADLVPGASKLQAIKEVREVVGGLGLASAKRIIDGAGSEPTVLRAGVDSAVADSLKRTLESAGLVIEIRPASPAVPIA